MKTAWFYVQGLAQEMIDPHAEGDVGIGILCEECASFLNRGGSEVWRSQDVSDADDPSCWFCSRREAMQNQVQAYLRERWEVSE